jgi:hypothetical protein
MKTKPEHPWNAFLEARKRAMQWMRADGKTAEEIADLCSVRGAAHVESILAEQPDPANPGHPK